MTALGSQQRGSWVIHPWYPTRSIKKKKAWPSICIIIIIIIIYPLTTGFVGAAQMTSPPVSSIFLFSTALWDLMNSRPVHSLMLSSHLFFRLPCLLAPLKHCLARWFWPDLMNGKHDHTTAVCLSLRSSEGHCVANCLLDLGTDFLVGNMVFV